jgi:predicted MFS family arabinose efflux permease
MTSVIPNDLEAGGGLQVGLIQVAITFGAATGGLLFDHAGWWSPFLLGAGLLVLSMLFSIAAARSIRSGQRGRCVPFASNRRSKLLS